MKKFLKDAVWLIFISFSIGYFYINRDKVKEMATTIGIYAKSIVISEQDISRDFKINDIKSKVNNYYYDKLDDNQKNIYKSLSNGIKELNKEIILKDYEYTEDKNYLEDVEKVFNYFCLDHPEVFYLNTNYTVTNMTTIIGTKIVLNVSYSINDIDELNYKINKINESIDFYLDKASNKNSMESEIILHDCLAEDVKYYDYKKVEEVTDTCHTIEGVFLNSEAVCDGFSKAMQILLSNVNIPSIVVLGMLEDEPHAWNMVKLEDQWYNLDITSNKSIKVDNLVIHAYFNVSDDFISKKHTFDEKEILPRADSKNNKYNYYFYNGKYINLDDKFNDKLYNIIIQNDNDKILEFYTEIQDNVPNDTYNAIISFNVKGYLKNNHFRYYNISNVYVILKNK